jgi:hypothetical protein
LTGLDPPIPKRRSASRLTIAQSVDATIVAKLIAAGCGGRVEGP